MTVLPCIELDIVIQFTFKLLNDMSNQSILIFWNIHLIEEIPHEISDFTHLLNRRRHSLRDRCFPYFTLLSEHIRELLITGLDGRIIVPIDPRPGNPRPKDRGIKTKGGVWVVMNETVSPGGSGGNSGESLYSAGPGQSTINDVASLIDHLLQGEAAHETIDDVSSLIDSMLKQ